MTTPTNSNRDTDRAAGPEPRPRLDLSITKVAAGATAAALAAAVGSKLGVAGTIVGAAVASVVATSASAVIGHSLERGKTAARKAMPVLDPESLETALLSRARIARAERTARAATHVDEAAALTATHVDEAQVKPSLADRALADSALDEVAVSSSEQPRTWRDRIPGRKPLMAAAIASFLLGTGAVTALEVARKGEFPGYHSNVFTNDPGQSGGSHDQPSQQPPGGNGTHKATTPSQKPDSPSTPTRSGSPSGTPSTPSPSGSTSSAPTTPATSPSASPSTPATPPPTSGSSGAGPTSAPSTSGGAPTPTATGAAEATPGGGATSGL